MEIKIQNKEKYIIIQIFGNLDIYTAVDLKSHFDKINIAKDAPLVLELSNLSYMDSSGIGALIKLANQVKEANGILYLTGIKPIIQKVFKIAGLTGYFNVLSEDDFLSKFS
ncbi:MAG: STAS domain-containing protein [Spirochaetia bacterium]|nr:STAS domain-containing protein [Spirochaetia bacterium]